MNDTTKKKRKSKQDRTKAVKVAKQPTEVKTVAFIEFSIMITMLFAIASVLVFLYIDKSNKVDHLEVIIQETRTSNDLFMKETIEARNKFFRLDRATTNMAIREIGSHEDYYNSSSDTIRLDNRKLIRRIDGSFVIASIDDAGSIGVIAAAGPFKDLKQVLKYMNENNYVQLE